MTSQAQQALDHDFDLDVRVLQLPSIPQAEMNYSVGCSTDCTITIGAGILSVTAIIALSIAFCK